MDLFNATYEIQVQSKSEWAVGAISLLHLKKKKSTDATAFILGMTRGIFF